MRQRTQQDRSQLTEVAPAHALPPRESNHVRNAIVTAGVGCIGFGLAPVAGMDGLGPPLLAACVGLGGAIGIHGERQARRHQLEDRLIEALAELLRNHQMDRRVVRATSWTGGRYDTPRKIVIRYNPRAADTNPGWLSEILLIVATRLGADYEVAKHDRHDRRECRLVLQLASPDTEPEAEVTPARARAERTVTELLGPTSRVADVETKGEEIVRITAEHEAATKLATSGYRARVERVISTVLPGRWRARWDLENDRVTFEVRPTFPENVWLPPVQVDEGNDILSTYDDVAIPYGIDEDGHELVWRPAIDPNLMVVGAPGTGKTVLEHSILGSVSRYGWPIWVADGKSVEFLGFRDWPNVQVVATSVPEQVAVIERAHEVMERRYQLIVNGQARTSDFEPLMVFLDEFADFRANLVDWYAGVKIKGDPAKPRVLDKAASIARKGRTSRVHLLFATQRPDAEYFGGDMRDNFRARISMGRLSPQGAMMMWQDPTIGTSVPRGCRGRATTINDENRPVEIQTYRMLDPGSATHGSAADIERLDELRPDTTRHPRLVILPPEREVDLDDEHDGEQVPPTYYDYAMAEWDLAENHPTLAPTGVAAIDADDARRRANPMTVIGVTSPTTTPAVNERPARRELASTAPPAARTAEPPTTSSSSSSSLESIFAGYGPPTDVAADQIEIGDLILVDSDFEHWAVVDQEPGDDPTDPTALAIGWRDDADNVGLLSLADGERATVRHPREETDA